MFWVVLIIFLLVVVYLDQIGWLQYRVEVVNGKIFLKHYFKSKEIKISSISLARILLKGAYANKIIQVKTDSGWEDVGKITFLNYKSNHKLLGSLRSGKPDIEFSPELESYFKADNIGDYFINRKQAYRGLLLIFIFAILILLSYVF